MLFLVFLNLILKEIVNKSVLLTFCGPFMSSVTHPCRQSWLQFSLASVSRKVTLWIRQMFNPMAEILRVRKGSVFWRKIVKCTRRICQVVSQARLSPSVSVALSPPTIVVVLFYSGFN